MSEEHVHSYVKQINYFLSEIQVYDCQVRCNNYGLGNIHKIIVFQFQPHKIFNFEYYIKKQIGYFEIDIIAEPEKYLDMLADLLDRVRK